MLNMFKYDFDFADLFDTAVFAHAKSKPYVKILKPMRIGFTWVMIMAKAGVKNLVTLSGTCL